MNNESVRVPRVAVVKADFHLCDSFIVPGLREAGLEAAGFGDAAQLYRAMVSTTFDVIVLGADLPGEDGFSAAEYLRSVSTVGIIMLGHGNGDSLHIRALQAGADAYLETPVTIPLLEAAVRAVRRRLDVVEGAPADTASAADESRWSLTADDWCLLAPEGTDVELTAQERTLLRSLFAADQQTVARESLVGLLSDRPEDFDPHRLDMLVHRLRRKVSKRTGLRLPLRAVRGQGYVLLPSAPGRAHTSAADDLRGVEK